MGFSMVNGQLKTYKKGWTAKDYTPWHSALKEIPPCISGKYILDFFNKAEVRAALHVPDNYPGWDLCQSSNWFKYRTLAIGSEVIYTSLKNKIRMLHFSGDVDAAVPTDGTYNWIQSTNPTILEAYRPWRFGDHVAGWVEEYDGLTFATVHGAGHMVPQDKPAEAKYLIYNWINQNRLADV